MKKGKKYNFIVILLVFIISAVAGISVGMKSGVVPNEIIIGGESENFEEIIEVPSDLKAPAASAKPLTKLLFAIDVLNNGKGFRSQSSQTLWINTLNVGQYMRFEKMRGGGLNIAQEWFRFSKQDGILGNTGKNEYRVQYADGEVLKNKTITDKAKFDFDSKHIDYNAEGELELFNYHTYLQERFPLNNFFLNVEAGSVGIIKEDKHSNSKSYIIEVQINVAGLSQKYINTFTANGGSKVVIENITLTFYISKTTGFLQKVKKNENFLSKYSIFEGSCTATLEEVYIEMNVSKEAEIKEIARKLF